jgi:polyhydroxybutyrate depolymerase
MTRYSNLKGSPWRAYGWLVILLWIVSSMAAQEPGTHDRTVLVDGTERRYLVHLPQGYDRDRKWPVVIMFHGGGGKGRTAMWDTGWAELADQEGFLAVFPEGTPPDPSRPSAFVGNPQTWNDGSRRPTVTAAERKVPDVKFVSALLADLKQHFHADDRRIYATGFSNGASMSFRLARELPAEFAAIAPVAGADWLSGTLPDRPVPVLYITGSADPLNPLDGGEIHIGRRSYGEKPASGEMIRKWAKLHGCEPEPSVILDEKATRAIAYRQPGGGQPVVFYTLDGHGHHWPGGKVILPGRLAGENTATIKATKVIWQFFKKQALPEK